MAHETDQPTAETAFPVVGVGASAGGLEALTQLLQALPAAPGLALIVVQHLDPKHESVLPGLLARVTSMPIQPVQDGTAVQPNRVYVAPSHADVVITRRVLHLVPRPPYGPHMPIDLLFRSLAEDQGPHAVGIILSGTGSDGALGLREIKEHGGVTLVQDEQTAAFTGMPHSAIVHGAVDIVRSPPGLAEELLQIVRHPYITTALVSPDASLAPVDDREAWSQILTLLQDVTGVNFAAYKPSTIQRRIARRMALRNLEQVSAYVRYLQVNRSELEALYHDLLIKVTSFFRDPGSYEALTSEVLPRLMSDRPLQQPLRIWVPGCSTGEEVYSLAICVVEYLNQRNLPHSIRLFATDIDEHALAQARSGMYLENIALDVSPERLHRFFVKLDMHYQINQAIREHCVFARYNLYFDPPFSHLDLISCRNVLIYFDSATQRRVIPLFHYALQPNGVLVLGRSETIGPFTDLFTLTDPQHKIYAKKATALPANLDFRHQRWDRSTRASEPGSTARFPPSWPPIDPPREADSVLLQQYAPAAVVVNDHMDILHFRGNTDRFLRPAPGRATLNLFRMAREGLLADLRAAIEEAQRAGTEVRRKGARLYETGAWQEVTIRVLPLVRPAAAVSHYLVVFDTPNPTIPDPSGPPMPAAPTPPGDLEQMNRLQQELEAMRLYLQSVMEQHEVATEELKAANEEVISSNEELQSTNEELETAKEELQSMNEELITTNDELRRRNQELSQANSDLTNLFSSINLPVVIVDKDLRLRRSTAMAEAVLHLIPTDIGRPIGHLRLNVSLPDLEDTLRHVIDTGTPHAREVQDREGHWWNLRILPYEAPDRTVDGAVLLLIDIDSLKNVDRLTRLLGEVEGARQYAEAIVQTVPEPLVILDGGLQVRTVNQAFYQHFGVSPAETVGRVIYQVGNGQWDTPRLRELLEHIIPQHGEVHDFEVTQTLPGIGARTLRLDARRLVRTGTSDVLIVLTIMDMTAQRRAHDQVAAALREKEILLQELHHRVKNNLQLVSSLLNLQADAVRNPAVQQAFAESQRRIRAMALIHEQLSSSPTLGQIEMSEYIRRLARQLFDAFARPDDVDLVLDLEPVTVSMDTAIPCGLILTELMTNVLEHAFPAGQQGEVSITWRADAEGQVLLAVRDTGIGMPPEMDFNQADSLGASLVRALVEQLGGSLQVERGGGTTVAVRFSSRPVG